MMLIGYGHQEVMAWKGYVTKYIALIYLNTLCSNTFAHLILLLKWVV